MPISNPSNPDISLIIPTRNRAATLRDTLSRLAQLQVGQAPLPAGGQGVAPVTWEIIVVDNGSTDDTSALQAAYPDIRWIALGENLGAAARNVGAMAARADLLLMLDDDSWPADGTIERIVRLFRRRSDLGAVACRVRLADPPHRHDAGGVPGIFFNCGGAVRRNAFIEAGGFPIDYDYYAEEYALACRLWQRGWRIEPFGDLLIYHRRTAANRDNNRMLRLLVRNNTRLWMRYAPPSRRPALLAQTIDRYRRVAFRENARDGYLAGLAECRAIHRRDLHRTTPLSDGQFDGLMGLDVAAVRLRDWITEHCIRRVGVWKRGKGCEEIIKVLVDHSVNIAVVYDGPPTEHHWQNLPVRDPATAAHDHPEGFIIGALSPGVAEDWEEECRNRWPGKPVLNLAPWRNSDTPQGAGLPATFALAGDPSSMSATLAPPRAFSAPNRVYPVPNAR